MIFLKHFDIANQKLTGVGKVYVPRANKVADLIPIINERMRWTSTTPLKLYEVSQRLIRNKIDSSQPSQEIKPGMIELMKPKLTFTQSEIQDGDIICFQVDLNEKE